MAGARRQVIHAMPASSLSAVIRVLVIIPRSPTMTASVIPNLPRTISTASVNALGSPVLPANTRTATGQPSRAVISPYSICCLPRLPSREWPNAASSQRMPSTHEHDRSNSAAPGPPARPSAMVASSDLGGIGSAPNMLNA